MAGSWALAEELFARGDPAFVGELRRVHNPEPLGAFAACWLADTRDFARNALLEYLNQPFNCYRHEALVKRLFKLAQAAGDDIVMGAFLVAFDRSIRRKRTTRHRSKSGVYATLMEADAAAADWRAAGFATVNVSRYGTHFHTSAWTETPVVAATRDTMPRPPERLRTKDRPVHDGALKRLSRFRLFSLPTRRYLRRRAWRYFRNLAASDPARYREAILATLVRYTDTDVDDDIHLIDNWGLMHVLYHDSLALKAESMGWRYIGPTTELSPAPYCPAAWTGDATFQVMLAAKAGIVHQWAIALLRRDHADWLANLTTTLRLQLADHADAQLSALGFDLLEQSDDLASVPVDEWLKRLNGDDLDKLHRLADLLTRKLDAERVSADDALRLATHRVKPVAELGFHLLERKAFSDPAALWSLLQAECDAVRPRLTQWLRDTLTRFGPPRADWLIEFLDAKHVDVRAAGWDWLMATPLRDEPGVWYKLIESPYDDVRQPLVAELNRRSVAADPDAVRWLWATMLLNIVRGGRQKPGVVKQVVARLTKHPAEADVLLPLLAVAVRSLRGPEFRAGLAGVVGLIETNPELGPRVRQRFPELTM